MAWVLAADCSALDRAEVIGVDCGARRLALYKLGSAYFATDDVCPHEGGSLSEGTLEGNCIECPLHAAQFDVRTGKADGAITDDPVPTFKTKVENGQIYVDLD
ncbi:MAG TPA: non-heme iron oxygenase ferredoxin subunit [Xanthobacteraceae bacterium]|jgi:nitrite reductase/ring-hydroxylating ferredoxin subunit